VATLFNPPQTFDLPLTLRRDLHFDFMYKPLLVDANGEPILDANGNPQYQLADYPPGAVVTLEIDTSPLTSSDAVISTHHAVVEVDFALTDPIAAKVPWRIRLIQASWDDVMAQGQTKRFDP
jgi:hypothetical protein